MWKNLSLRARLFLPLGVLFVIALLIGASALEVFSPSQFVYENRPEGDAVRVVSQALNNALRTSPAPRGTLDAFAASLESKTAVIQYRPAEHGEGPPPMRTISPGVPHWFVRLLTIPELGAAYPVMIDGLRVGDVLFAPDISADVFEKWAGFLAIVLSATVLLCLTGTIAYFMAGAVLRPLLELGEGLTRMREGRYDRAIPESGPPEIRRSCIEANELACTLGSLIGDNRELLHKIVSLQDTERQELAAELHDELGPMLFAIRANSTVLQEQIPAGIVDLQPPLQHMLQAAEALQSAIRRILDGLHPLYLDDLGLVRSLGRLIENFRAQAPGLRIRMHVDAELEGLDALFAHTVYRVVQEATTNVLRHAHAKSAEVSATVEGGQIIVQVSDDGVGLPEKIAFGRGLSGMRERLRALGGSFELFRTEQRTSVCCRLPHRAAGPAHTSALRGNVYQAEAGK
jgi:two-component system, NarL family, sensor histidine kinase UhpB